MTILVVDDLEDYRLLLRAVLSAQGWTVVLAGNGEEALQKTKKVKPDIVISDVYMPVMDGIRFHREIRNIPGYEQLPFLFMSGSDDAYTREAVQDPRYEGFLPKTSPPPELMAWIEYLVRPPQKRLLRPPSNV